VAKFNETRSERSRKFRERNHWLHYGGQVTTGSKTLKRHGIPREDRRGNPRTLAGFVGTPRRVEVRAYRMQRENVQLQRRINRAQRGR
jgi:hypothetical protein